MWSLEEEEELLSGIIEHGYGNWDKIWKEVPNHDAFDCEEHYVERFLKNPEPDLQKVLDCHRRSSGLCSYNCKISLPYDPDSFTNNHSLSRILDTVKDINCLDEKFDKRYNPWKNVHQKANDTLSALHYNSLKRDKILGISHSLLSGYNPNRAEFEIEYDDKAESIFVVLNENDEDSDFDDPDDEHVNKELRVALVDSYNFRLYERKRRKTIIRKHALLDRRKSFSVIQRYENVCGRRQLQALFNCMRFISGPAVDFLLEQLKYQRDLKVRINRLSGYRRLGIKHFDIIPLYEKLYRKRMKHKHELEMSASSLNLGMKYQKRSANPLDIHNLPGYSELEDEERELCSVSRIVPETYLSFKHLMIQECQKLDGLKLAQARLLFKIDVNKTRKMFDHLMSKNLIWLPETK